MLVMQKDASNIFLQSLLPRDYAIISSHLDRVTFSPRSLLLQMGQPIEYIDFVEDGILALSVDIGAGADCLTAVVGREGFVGWPVLMDGSHSPCTIHAGGEGVSVLRVELSRLLASIQRRPSLAASLVRFVHAVMVQMNSTIMSSKTDPVNRRLARLILMYHDRGEPDEICIIHQDMADMLVIRRASVTDALHVMEGNKLIASIRNRIVMRDRPGLCLVAGKAYGFAEEHYSQRVAPLFAGR